MKKILFKLAKTPIGDLIVGLAFNKFSKLLPVKRIIDNKHIIAFWHPKPFYEKHILIVPKKSIQKLTKLGGEDLKYVSEVYKAAQEIVVLLNWEKEGYSILMNGGNRQEVNQIHFHLISGKVL